MKSLQFLTLCFLNIAFHDAPSNPKQSVHCELRDGHIYLFFDLPLVAAKAEPQHRLAGFYHAYAPTPRRA